MSDFQAIADHVEIAAQRGEFTDAVKMDDHDRPASLFSHRRRGADPPRPHRGRHALADTTQTAPEAAAPSAAARKLGLALLVIATAQRTPR